MFIDNKIFMIFDEELITKVKNAFGLNTYEAKIWLALLSKGIATASELAELADVPRSRAYDILETLEKKGFVIMKLGKPIKYVALSPSDVVDRLKKRYEEHISAKMKNLESLKSSEFLKELENLHKTGIQSIDISERSGEIKGQQNILGHLDTMLRQAESTVNMILTELTFAKVALSLKPVFMNLKMRNVQIKILTPIVEENARLVREIQEYAQIYDSRDLRGRIVTVDGEEVLMMIFDDKEVHSVADIGVWLYAPNLAKFIDSTIDKLIPMLKPASQKLAELNF